MRTSFAAAFLVLSVTGVAAAETPRQMQVALGDLNLDRPAGQAAAQARIHAAAVRLCGSTRFTMEHRGWANSDTVSNSGCVARAIAGANAQLANAR